MAYLTKHKEIMFYSTIQTGQEALKNTGKTEYKNEQETSTLCHAISTALQMVF